MSYTGDWIEDKLLNVTALKGSVVSNGWVREQDLSEKRTPFITYEKFASPPVRSKSGFSQKMEGWRVTATAASPKQASELADQIETALEGVTGTAKSVTVKNCSLEDRTAEREGDNWTETCEFEIRVVSE